ncbi:glycosyltransferase family 4 protein, partial [candidate division WOR-3 bacterium]|nr:glycosyltransferase family 4 protein [candidate division WOR-3 bacterium]
MRAGSATPADHVRVCLVSAAYRPYLSGVGEHVHDLALALRDLGHSVHILTSRFPSLEPGSPGPESSGPPVTRLGRGLVVPALGGHFTLPVGLDLSRRVRDFLHRHDFDVVHCHGIFPPETAYWAALHARCPVVVTFHTLAFRPPRFFRAGFRALFPAVGRRLRARIAVSQACADWARTFFPGECRVIPNGVDSGRFGPSV